MTNQRQIEERSFDRSQALRQFVVIRGDRLMIYEHERETTDSEDYDRNEQQFIIGRKDGIIELNEKKLTFTLQL